MLVREDYLKSVSDFLARLELSIRNRGFAQLLDINIVAKTFFAHFLSALYRCSFVNLNIERGNSPSIDLGDKERRVAFQVTSTKAKSKIQATIRSFSNHGLATDYDTLNILIIGSRQRTYESLDAHGINFDPDTNIVDIRGIIKQLQSLETSELYDLCKLIERESGTLAGESTEPTRLWLSEDTHECYFNIPSYGGNDYPREGRASYTFFRFVLRVCFPTRDFIHKIEAHLFNPRPEHISELYDTGEAALYHSYGPEMGQAIQSFVDKNPPFQPLALEPNVPFQIVLPKYARVPSNIFHKSQSPFYAVLVFHQGMQFIHLLCMLPLMGTGRPMLSKVYEVRSEVVESLVHYARRAYEANAWVNSIEIR
jgi:hypothetical protein